VGGWGAGGDGYEWDKHRGGEGGEDGPDLERSVSRLLVGGQNERDRSRSWQLYWQNSDHIYMLEGRGSQREAARTYAYQHPDELDALLDVLVESTARYLVMQAKSGAQVLKLFESWAEGLSEPLFDRLVTKPHTAIIEGLRARGVTTPVIGFPRGAGTLVEAYARTAPVQGVALDTQASAALGQAIQKTKAIQGALDPLLLRAGGDALLARVDQLLEQWGGGPYIFNLGHGVMPDTPIAHIARVVERVTGKPVKALAAE